MTLLPLSFTQVVSSAIVNSLLRRHRRCPTSVTASVRPSMSVSLAHIRTIAPPVVSVLAHSSTSLWRSTHDSARCSGCATSALTAQRFAVHSFRVHQSLMCESLQRTTFSTYRSSSHSRNFVAVIARAIAHVRRGWPLGCTLALHLHRDQL